MEVTHVENIPNLTAAQRAFRIDGGHVVVVEITQQEIAANAQNLTSEHHVALKVRAWKVNPDGSVAKDLRDKALEIPLKIESIVSSALAEGTVDLENYLVNATQEALLRAKNWLHVKAAMEKIPVS